MNKLTEKINALRQERNKMILVWLLEGKTYQRTAELAGVAISTVCTIAAKNGIRRSEQGRKNAAARG